MKNKIIIPSILFASVSIFSIIIISQNENNNILPIQSENNANIQNQEIILFYGDGCPHCEIVEEYISQNNVETKVSFAKKEAYYNKQNANDLASKAKACGIPTDSIGVPFLWDGSKCLVGDQDIIEFFKSKINEQ